MTLKTGSSVRIKDPEVRRLARELADLRGTTVTAAVREALAETLEREGDFYVP